MLAHPYFALAIQLPSSQSIILNEVIAFFSYYFRINESLKLDRIFTKMKTPFQLLRWQQSLHFIIFLMLFINQ